jgi:hypothetical protein
MIRESHRTNKQGHIPAIYVAHDFSSPFGPVRSLEVPFYPVNEMIFERAFDNLMEEIRG